MQIIKISSLACPSCIVMNKVINKIKEKYKINVIEFDYDFDQIDKYNVGKILPVFIFEKDNVEVARLIGEKKIEDFEEIIGKYEEDI